MRNPEQRLFTPGAGATPPALTGREREEAVLKRCLGVCRIGRTGAGEGELGCCGGGIITWGTSRFGDRHGG